MDSPRQSILHPPIDEPDEVAILVINHNPRSVAAVCRAIAACAEPLCNVLEVVDEYEHIGAVDELSSRIDVVLIATDMLAMVDIETVRRLSDEAPRALIMVAYRNASPARAAAVIAAGASEIVQFRGEDPSVLHWGLRNVVARRVAARRTTGQLLSDPVTGLLNRSTLSERITVALREAERPDEELALLYMDLDRFKHINDSLGHSAGDRVLALVARQLESAVTETGCTAHIARFGGDEYVILIEGDEAMWSARRLAHRVRTRLQRPIQLQGHAASVTPSIGLAAGMAGDEAAGWIDRADMALYRAKSNGRNRVEEFDRSLEIWAVQSNLRSEELRKALRNNGLTLKITSVEWCADQEPDALIATPTWEGTGALTGASLQRVADQCGLGPELARWTIVNAIELASRRSIPINVPFASCLFALSSTASFIEAALAEAQVAPSRIRLLIEEDVLGAEDIVGSTIEALRSLGVGLVIDGFGARSGSIAALARWRLDSVILDAEWVLDAGALPDRAAALGGLLRLLQALGYVVTAPHVVSQRDRAQLHYLGCDQEIVPLIEMPENRVQRRHPNRLSGLPRWEG